MKCKMKQFLAVSAVIFVSMVALLSFARAAEEIDKGFANPPAAARPWVYWFWLNGNITKEGITADLEAMKNAGIGGVLIMEVDQGAPVGPVDFMSPKWREMFKHVAAEANRLGLEVNMNNDGGWNGSGGPWIKPEESMQRVVVSETNVEGPKKFEEKLPTPQTVAGYYRDIQVLAIPTPGSFRIKDVNVKGSYDVGFPGASETTKLPPEMVIDRNKIVNLTEKMDKDGKLTWDVPVGKWTVLRFGHTSTGIENAPSPKTARGLECDKLSKAGIEANFNGMMGKLIDDVGTLVGKSLVATHIDSWENGSQNWTALMREEFQKRRGYDLLPWLPVLTGRVIDNLEVSERFLWDLRQTVSELVVENYAGHMLDLAHKHGLRLSIEAYGGPCDNQPYAGRADEPMCEFWIGGGAFETCKEMASAAHTYGKPILGAESFTAADQERWLEHPATYKALGDKAMCAGVNRFVFHRYAMQPWLNYKPGMTMGPWGLHYERTETWWNMIQPWHEYLARCHYLLRQGKFYADICYLQPESAPQSYRGHELHGYDFDVCSAEVVLTRMKVKDGRLVLPDGMNYGVLALPNTTEMTPKLLRKIKELADAGAKIVGKPPVKSPSLSDYPHCDEEVKQLTEELWGKGKIVADKTPEEVLRSQGMRSDFHGEIDLNWIHRRDGNTDIYFVANGTRQPKSTTCIFRVLGKQPELWNPETGSIENVPEYYEIDGGTCIPLRFEPSESVFVVFRKPSTKSDGIVAFTRDGKPIVDLQARKEPIVIQKATYGVLTDVAKTRDVTAKVQKLLDGGSDRFHVARMAEGDDPAFGIVKTLIVQYTIGGKPAKATGQDPDTVDLRGVLAAERVAEVHADKQGGLSIDAWKPGRYELKTSSGKKLTAEVKDLPPAKEVTGSWEVRFAPNWGAPEKVTFDKLLSWSERPEEGVKYFSGTANYIKKLDIPKDMLGANRRLYLDLGNVQIMSRVKLNGKDLGILWKTPYSVDITEAAKAGENALEIEVVNLWPNRLIGDEQLPEDSDRNSDGTLKKWPDWVLDGKSSPTGRFTFTSWRLWRKGSTLLESGLLGPVQLQSVERVVPK
jgi:hypothetical protein